MLVQAGSAKVRNVGGNQLRLSAGSAEGSGLRLAFGSHSTRCFALREIKFNNTINRIRANKKLRIFLISHVMLSGCIARAKNFRERPTFLSALAINLATHLVSSETELLMCGHSLSCLAP